MSRTAQSPEVPLGPDAQSGQGGLRPGGAVPEYMTTEEAAAYLRRTPSWLLRQPTIRFLPGRPNTYARRHLDQWFDDNAMSPLGSGK